MKKNNEGYTLPFVMAVLAVMCIVASSVLSVGLRNLQSQRNAVEQMQDKYEAEGKIEIVVAQLLDERNYTDISNQQTASTPGNETITMEEAIQSKIKSLCGDHFVKDTGVWSKQQGEGNGFFTYSFGLTSTAGNRKINCVVELTGNIKASEIGDELSEETVTIYTVKDLDLIYKKYQIGGAA